MRSLQALSLAVFDAVLYLDTHPDDEEALEYYRHHKELRDRCAAEYVAHVGPLTAGDCPGEGHWTWTEGPWPWEGEF